jgi:hypothetical protein
MTRSLFIFLIFFFQLIPPKGYSALSLKNIYSQEDTIFFNYDTVYLEAIGKNFEPGRNVTEYQSEANLGGNTSVRNVDLESLKWKTQGYFQRNRDLGQIFIPKKDTEVRSIVTRTGPAESAVLYNTPGAKVFLQFFEIKGEPVINDNGTPQGTSSTHGFSTNHRTDDFIEGIEYISLPTIYRGIFPQDIPVTKNEVGDVLGNDGRLYYFRWIFNEPLFFEANKRYGFIMGLLEPGTGYGFTLANANKASVSDVPSLDDRHTPYKGGWCFRREGDGTLPPTMYPGENPPDSENLVHLLQSESMFEEGVSRFLLSPTSDGFPDVDTYRSYEFYIEEENNYVELEGIELEKDSLELSVGSVYALQPGFIPGNATNQNVTWFSSDPTVVSVDPSGKLTSHKEGLAAITVLSEEGNFNYTCLVIVYDNTTSLKNVENDEFELLVYPNPASDKLTVHSPGGKFLTIGIYTLDGRKLLTKIMNGDKIEIDLDIETGLYMVKVSINSKDYSQLLFIE